MLASIGTFSLATRVSVADDTQAVVKKAADTATEMAKDKSKDAATNKATHRATLAPDSCIRCRKTVRS